MTDDQVERIIWQEIAKRDITFYDMIGLPGHGVDPNPEDEITPRCEKGIRSNRFQSFGGSDRMKELLCAGKWNKWDEYPALRISLQDLFRFWWNRCVVREYVVDEILEDIFEYFTEKMRPPSERMGFFNLEAEKPESYINGSLASCSSMISCLASNNKKGEVNVTGLD
jgi:hypothetical protein